MVSTVKAGQLVPFLDMAYQGFGHGIAQDGAVISKFVDAGLSFLVATSFSTSESPTRSNMVTLVGSFFI